MGEKENLSLESEKQDRHEEVTKPKPIEPCRPPMPFPQRLAKAKLRAKCAKFLEALKKLQINFSFLNKISKMPSYAKFNKEMLFN